MLFVDGRLLRGVSLTGNPTLASGLRLLGLDETGRALMSTASYSTNFTEPWLQGHLVRVDLQTLRADTLGTFDLASSAPRDGPRNPFRPVGQATASGPRFVIARSDKAELTWRDSEGRLRQILRWNPAPAFPSEGDLEAIESSMIADLRRVNPDQPEADLQRFIQEVMDNTRVPPDEPLPLFLQVTGDGDGGVWLSPFEPTVSAGNYFPARYEVIGPDGTGLGGLLAPPRFRLLDIAGSRVLGVLTDPLGVESVVLYSLQRAPPGG
jgi:hypothetical protein